MTAIRNRISPLQIIEMTGPTGGHPLDPSELAEMVPCGPPLQMLDAVEPSTPIAVPPADAELVRDLITRLGPDAVQQLLDEHRRAG